MCPSPGASSQAGDDPSADVYLDLRRALFGVDPARVGLSRESGGGEVWGLLMETGYPGLTVTLVAVADGTVSLYFSNGGATLGLGALPGPQRAAEALLQAAPEFLAACRPTTDHPLPGTGNTRFYLLTFDGVFTAEAGEDDLGYNRHPLSPLFHLAYRLLAEVQPISEGLENRAEAPSGDG